MQRQHTFDNEYMDFNFTNLHQREIGDDTAMFGNPDDGNGRYMQGKPYHDWYFFNIGKRIHQNDTEHITTMIPLALVNGLLKPYPTIALLLTYFLGRNFYTAGYFEKEGALNNKRMFGSALCNIAHVGILGLTIYNAFLLRQGKVIAQLLPKL